MKRINYLPFVLLLMSCSPQAGNKQQTTPVIIGVEKFHQMEWLIGTWQSKSGGGMLNETWRKNNDSTLIGQSVMIVNSDTTLLEKLELQLRGNKLFYIATAIGQNGGVPVSFELYASVNNRFLFENSAHDYPQRIIYSKITPDSLVARIEGRKVGQFQYQDYRMSRMH